MDYKGMRYTAGLSLRDIADRTGYSRSHVANVESGTTKASKVYEEAFQLAIKAKSDTQLAPNTSKAYHQLSHLIHQAGIHTQDLQTAALTAKSCLKTYEQALELMKVLTSSTALAASTTDFDIMEANSEEQKTATNDIISIWTSALKKYNIHQQDQDTRDQIIDSLIEVFKEEFGGHHPPSHTVLP